MLKNIWESNGPSSIAQNFHNKNSHNWYASETRDTKAKLVKILLFTYPYVKSVKIQPKLFLKATIKKLYDSATTHNTFMNCKDWSKTDLELENC